MKSQTDSAGDQRAPTTSSSRLWRALDKFSNELGWISGGLTLVMMGAVVREVLGRYLFDNPSDWSLELSCYLVVAMGYLASAFTELRDRHIRIDFIYERFRGRTKQIVDIIIALVGLIWSSVLVWQGSRIALHSLITNARSETIMRWPLFPAHAMVPVGAFLLCLVLVGKIVKGVSSLTRREG